MGDIRQCLKKEGTLLNGEVVGWILECRLLLLLQLVINGKPLRIMGSAMSGVNLENCAHPCLRNPCDHGGECIPQMDSFKCHCPLGYRDSLCSTHMDRQDLITPPRLNGDSFLKFTHPKVIKRFVDELT